LPRTDVAILFRGAGDVTVQKLNKPTKTKKKEERANKNSKISWRSNNKFDTYLYIYVV